MRRVIEEALVHVSPPWVRQDAGFLIVLEEVEDLLGRFLHAGYQVASNARRGLEQDAARVPRHGGRALSESLGDDEPEAFTDGLLDHDGREALEDVDLDIAGPVRFVGTWMRRSPSFSSMMRW